MENTKPEGGRIPLPEELNGKDKAVYIARLADDQKAEDVTILDVRGRCNFTDFFIIATCTGRLQMRAVAGRIMRTLRDVGERPYADSGNTGGGWQTLDYGDSVVHLFDQETRDYYRLEQLWSDSKRVKWQEAANQ